MQENSSNKLIVGHLSINSKRNKFGFSEDVINRNIDITLFSEKMFKTHLLQRNLFQWDMMFHTGLTGTLKLRNFYSIFMKPLKFSQTHI